MRVWSILPVAALLLTVPAAAQQAGHGTHQMPMPQADMQHCMAMMGGPHPQMLLHHGADLGLTAGQVTRLEALRDQAQQAAMPRMQATMQAHMAAAELLKGDTPDFQGYEAKLREAADQMVQMHVGMARIAVQAGGVLTSEQRARLNELGGGAAMMGGQHGMMGADSMGMAGGGMGGMMMGCMMMGMGDAGDGPHNH